MTPPFYITEPQFKKITDALPTAGGNYEAMYRLIYEAVQDPSAINGSSADGAVQAWFGAAAEANSGVGAASTLIRNYTQAQIEIRAGKAISGFETIIQNASNTIARAVYLDIAGNDTVIDGELYYEIPGAVSIGQTDGTQAILSLNADIPSLDIGTEVWSGNPLYLGLGSDIFWNEVLLNDTSNPYNVLVAVQALKVAGISASFGEILSLFSQFASGIPLAGAAATLQASSATFDYLYEAYGNAGAAHFANLFVSEIVVGSLQGDTFQLYETERDIFMHTGVGHDVIYGFSDKASAEDVTGIIDGGAGIDLVSYQTSSEITGLGYDVFVRSIVRDVPFSAYVDLPYGGLNELFNIEILKLGVSDDTLYIDELDTTLTLIDALENSDVGDTIDVSGADSGATVSLEGNSVTLDNSSKSLNVTNFENVIGSEHIDTITGNDEGNILHGSADDDTINGGAGDDQIDGGADSDVIDGGAGADIIEGGLGTDILRGGDDGDLMFADSYGGTDSSDSELYGEAGNDILVADNGGNTLDGGDGMDILFGGEGEDVLTGGEGNDLIVAAGGGDYVNGGAGNDWIFATAGSEAVIHFDGEGGYDHIDGFEREAAVSEIVFDGILGDNVELIWDYEFLSTSGSVEIPDDYEPNFEEMFDEWQWFGGEAYIRIKSTGATINIGYVLGSYTQRIQFLVPDESSEPGAYETHYIQGWHANIVGEHRLSFENGYTRLDVNDEVDGENLMNAGQITRVEDGEILISVNNGIVTGTALDTSSGLPFVKGTVFQSTESELVAERFTNQFDSIFVDRVVPEDLGALLNDATKEDLIVNPFTEDVSGTSSSDIVDLSSSNSDTRIVTLGGNDIVVAGAGNNKIDGGTGDDRLTGGNGNDTFSFITGDGHDVITDFLPGSDQISIDGVSITDFALLPSGVTGTSVPSGAFILSYGNGDQIAIEPTSTLVETYPNLFVPNNGRTVTGTSANDVIDATYVDVDGDVIDNLGQTIEAGAGHDTILSGTGSDTINAGSGDDTIIYSGGDDIIFGYRNNYGFDTLDLSQYNADQVAFSLSGSDVLITTPDGVIQLNKQVYFDLGGANTNIDLITFADGTLDEAGIKTRVLAEQVTDGDDFITGTKFGDVLDGGLGNDTINAGSGDDFITGGLGDDTLTGSYGSDQFIFAAEDGDDVITDFADGTDFIFFTAPGLTENDIQIDTTSGDTVVNYGVGSSITVNNAALTIDDFLFA